MPDQPTTEDLGDLIRAEAARNPEFAASVRATERDRAGAPNLAEPPRDAALTAVRKLWDDPDTRPPMPIYTGHVERMFDLADRIAAYIRDGHPAQGDALDAQAAVDIAHARYARATTDEERAEVISELIGDWLAAWPRTAVTDPWDALAPEIVRMTRAASMVDTVPAYVHRLLDAFLDQAPLNFGTAAVPAEIQDRLTAAVCRGQLGTVRTHGPGAPRHDYHEGECGDLCDNREEQR